MTRADDINKINPFAVIDVFYPAGPLRDLLLKHSTQVRDKALEIAKNSGLDLDLDLVFAGAMLHDIGIIACDAPGILCTGSEPYIAHGVIGARMLREYAAAHGLDLEAFAAICEHHTGSGITVSEVRAQQLPIPEKDYLPLSLEEKAICLADKFFSKSGEMREKSPEKARASLQKFGSGAVGRFDALCRLFRLPVSRPER